MEKKEKNFNVSRNNNNTFQSHRLDTEKNTQSSNRIGFFHQPKDVLEKREKAWNQLFSKYENNSDEEEIDIEISKTEEDDDSEVSDYYVKSRTPLRKNQTLVQYWVDTGNPPYCAMLDVEHLSESISTLSEGKCIKTGEQTPNNQPDYQQKPGETTSVYTSVDTAAYIRSNTNVTEKAETIAIVEGSKIIDDPVTTENCDNNNKKNLNKFNNSSKLSNRSPEKIKHQIDEHIRNLNNEIEGSDYSVQKIIPQRSMKIADVLPALENLDRFMNPSFNTPTTKTQKAEKSLEGSSDEPIVNVTNGFRSRKLYTMRESPIDILSGDQENITQLKIKNDIHPAFATTPRPRNKRVRERSRYSRVPRYSTRRRTGLMKRIDKTQNQRKTHEEEEEEEEKEKQAIEKQSLKDKLENLKALCSKKEIVIRLCQIPDRVLPTREKKDVSEKQVLPRKITRSISRKKEIEIDSQESDHSTVSFHNNFKSISKSSNSSLEQNENGESSSKSIEQREMINVNEKKAKQKNIAPKYSKNKNINTEEILKKAKGRLYVYTTADSSSDDDEQPELPFYETERILVTKPTFSFSSDEEDEFIRMLKKNDDDELEEKQKPSSSHGDGRRYFIHNLTDSEPVSPKTFAVDLNDADSEELSPDPKRMIRKRSDIIRLERNKSLTLKMEDRKNKKSESSRKVSNLQKELRSMIKKPNMSDIIRPERKKSLTSKMKDRKNEKLESSRKVSNLQKELRSMIKKPDMAKELKNISSDSSESDYFGGTVHTNGRRRKFNNLKHHKDDNNHKDQNKKKSPAVPIITEDIILNNEIVIQDAPTFSTHSLSQTSSLEKSLSNHEISPCSIKKKVMTIKFPEDQVKAKVLPVNDVIFKINNSGFIKSAELGDKNAETVCSKEEIQLSHKLNKSVQHKNDKRLLLESGVKSDISVKSGRRKSHVRKVEKSVREKRSIAKVLEYSEESSEASDQIYKSPRKKIKLDNSLKVDNKNNEETSDSTEFLFLPNHPDNHNADAFITFSKKLGQSKKILNMDELKNRLTMTFCTKKDSDSDESI